MLDFKFYSKEEMQTFFCTNIEYVGVAFCTKAATVLFILLYGSSGSHHIGRATTLARRMGEKIQVEAPVR